MASESKIELAYRLAKAEAATGGKSVSDKDFSNAQARVRNMSSEQIIRLISDLESAGAAGKSAQPTNTGAVGKLQRLQQGLGMQYGGIADMSAAPMVKQQRQRKRSASSGFRTKFSKGGGVRSSKYKL